VQEFYINQNSVVCMKIVHVMLGKESNIVLLAVIQFFACEMGIK